MIIERTPDEIIFRLPGNLNLNDLQDLVDLLEYNVITKKSAATQEEVNILVKNIKMVRWERTKKQMD